MAITPAPTPPNSGDPANFNAQADAFLGWMATFGGELNAELPFISSKSWATRGGTANAITLTAGFTSLAVGMQVRFRATATNTGAATINLDGLGAVACRTITGAALPAGYIRTNADTVATYDGTYWVLDRQIERGSNANGDFIRLADGSQICIGSVVTLSDSNLSVTFPAAFHDQPRISLTVRSTAGTIMSTHCTAINSGAFNVAAFSASGRAAAAVDFISIARWY